MSNTPHASRRTVRRIVGSLTAAALAVPVLLLSSSPVAAFDVSPVASPDSLHVTADPLPTVQINGVVWDQVILGDTVYAVGEFSQARPAGSPLGVNETPRSNVLAYDLITGELITQFVANTNAEVKAITASVDGSRLYIGGLFTNVNGRNRYRVAALDPTTGAVITSFNAATNYVVHDLAVNDTTLYLGGKFANAGGAARLNVAAFDATTGAVLPWAPLPDDRVTAIALSPDGDRVFLGGMFGEVNGEVRRGLAAIDAATGDVLPWVPNDHFWAIGPNARFTALRVANGAVYGSGSTYGRNSGNLEGIFKADLETGEIEWVEDCHGDTYQFELINGYVYQAAHSHFCGNIGGQVQTDGANTQWGENMRHAFSFKDEASGQIRRDNWSYHNLEGYPSPSLTSWETRWQVGDYTGLSQAAWSVTGNSQYVVYGGEFPSVNNRQQQGLVRFAVRSIAPNKEGPRVFAADFQLNVVSPAPGEVRISFPANQDRDDHALTYDLLRNGSVVQTQVAESTFWDHPTLVFFESGLTPGQVANYRVRASDSTGNSVLSNIYPVTVATSGSPSPYVDQVVEDGANIYWRLGDTPGSSTAADSAALSTGGANEMEFGRPGAIVGDPDSAARTTGPNSRVVQPDFIAQSGPERNPAHDEFSIEIWFNTTTNVGGRLLGFGDRDDRTSSSNSRDRHLYLTDDGSVAFGVRTRAEGTGVTSSRERRAIQSGGGFNDGAWHHAVAVLDGNGMRLYVDGTLESSRSDVNSGHGYYGYWRVGGDGTSGFAGAPSSDWLDGDLDEAAVYYHALTPQQIQNHWILSGRAGNVAPTASFSWVASDLDVDFDGSGSTDLDGSIVSYAWTFGDGAMSSVESPSHTYAAADTYNVTLTVTDDEGATGVSSQQVTVVEPGSGVVFASDGFERAVGAGFGSADVGGAWTTLGNASWYSVDGQGVHALADAGRTRESYLSGVAAGDVTAMVDVSFDRVPTGGGMYSSLVVRQSGSSAYRARVRSTATSTALYLIQVANGSQTTLSATSVPGLVYNDGDVLRIKLEAVGSDPTTVSAKVWKVGTSEPVDWQLSVTNSTPALQGAGGVGMHTYLSASATAPDAARYDNLLVTWP